MKQSREQIDRFIATMERQTAEGDTKYAVHEIVRDANLSQMLVFLNEGGALSDHKKPPAAAMQVLRGTVMVSWKDENGQDLSETVAEGDFFVLPNAIHNVKGDGVACFLLTRVR
jgi:quercetin dioxygenase-like cupin family protein